MIRDRIHTGVLALSSALYVPLVHAARREALTEYDYVVHICRGCGCPVLKTWRRGQSKDTGVTTSEVDGGEMAE